MNTRLVKCKKLNADLPGLEKPPFKSDVGRLIYENISAQAWAMWKDMQIKVLNEYRLNMADPHDYNVLIDQMLTFLNLKEGQSAEVDNEQRGRTERS